MRVYLPATTATLRRLVETSSLGPEHEPGPLTGFAVTRGLREWYVDDDLESLEYAATLQAARASLQLLAVDPAAPPRRMVIAAELPESVVLTRDDIDLGVVHVAEAVTLPQVVSVHVDDQDAEPAVRAASEVIDAADLGDPAAAEVVDDTEGFELAWYANQEIAALLTSLSAT